MCSPPPPLAEPIPIDCKINEKLTTNICCYCLTNTGGQDQQRALGVQQQWVGLEQQQPSSNIQ